MNRLEKIKEILASILEDDNPLVKGLSNIAGTAVTAVARASGIPLVAGASNILGSQASKAFDNIFNKHNDITNKVSSNYYFYKDDYKQYQANNYGYDIELPTDKFTPEDIQKIRQMVYPSFKKFGYTLKVIGKRSEDKNLIAILFNNNSRIPLRDSKQNPIIYPLPFDILDNILDAEGSDIAAYKLLQLYNLQIFKL